MAPVLIIASTPAKDSVAAMPESLALRRRKRVTSASVGPLT